MMCAQFKGSFWSLRVHARQDVPHQRGDGVARRQLVCRENLQAGHGYGGAKEAVYVCVCVCVCVCAGGMGVAFH